MKKVIGILGVTAIVVAMFFSVNLANSVKNIDLASVITMNTVNAEIPGQDNCDPNSLQDYYADLDSCQEWCMMTSSYMTGQEVECHSVSTECCLSISCDIPCLF